MWLEFNYARVTAGVFSYCNLLLRVRVKGVVVAYNNDLVQPLNCTDLLSEAVASLFVKMDCWFVQDEQAQATQRLLHCETHSQTR